ncbi:hypothetical protein Glove_707g65 [Diversispora epigaea]|uniref:Uncharacterized protein n=1 Tax=Diversispora epigaea TaxID=1348612 RepID=A0A397G2W2_9GLOM|nr:hypothetical protein Glove_707g65 [Diversispora epigaea]
MLKEKLDVEILSRDLDMAANVSEPMINIEPQEMCLQVAMEICALGGNIKKATTRGFYERNIKKDGYISALDRIGLWVDSKNNDNLEGIYGHVITWDPNYKMNPKMEL